MTTTDTIALRVARRHVREAAVVLRTLDAPTHRVEYRDSGRIPAVELARMLEQTIGFVTSLRFRPAITGLPNTVAWEAIDENASVVSGRLVLRAGVPESGVVSWAEVKVDRAATAEETCCMILGSHVCGSGG
jgi:hypothetical protein